MLELDLFTLVHSTPGMSWTYPESCCSGNDCFKVPCDLIKQYGKDMYELTLDWYQYLFQGWKMKPSPDGDCHACVTGENTALCLFLPPRV